MLQGAIGRRPDRGRLVEHRIGVGPMDSRRVPVAAVHRESPRGEEPRPEPQAREHQGRDAHARRLDDDVPPLLGDPAAASRGVGVPPDRRRIFAVLGDADCRTAFCVVGNEFIARGVLGDAEDKYLSFVDPDRRVRRRASASPTCPRSCTCARTPRSVAAAEGWDPAEWQTVAKRGRQGDGLDRARGGRARRPAAHPRLAGLTPRVSGISTHVQHRCTGPPDAG